MENPFDFFGTIYCINLKKRTDRWKQVQLEFKVLGIHNKIIQFPAIETKGNGNIGCALSHRAIIEEAKKKKIKNILILEDDIEIVNYSEKKFGESLKKLQTIDWDLFYIGGTSSIWEFPYFLPEDGIMRSAGIGCTHGIAYNSSIYDEVLDILPQNITKMSKFITKYKSFDHYFVRQLQARKKTYTADVLFCVQRPDVSSILGKFSTTARDKSIKTTTLNRMYIIQILSFYTHKIMVPLWKANFALRSKKKKIFFMIKAIFRKFARDK